MDKRNEPEALSNPERDALMAFLLTLVLEAHQIIEEEDAETLVSLLNERIDDLLDFKDGKPLPEAKAVRVGRKKAGWKLV